MAFDAPLIAFLKDKGLWPVRPHGLAV